MEEKKLNDSIELYEEMNEKITKILDIDDNPVIRYASEYIKHLRKENEELKKDYIALDLEARELRIELVKELAEHEEFTQKAKAEIERLKEKNVKLLKTINDVNDLNTKLHNESIKLQANIKQLTKDFEIQRDKKVEYFKKTEELQTQVDELTEENAQLSEMADYDKGHKEGYEHGYNQAAKDTAKEIYGIAVNYYDGKNIDGAWFFGALEERYGVEVE